MRLRASVGIPDGAQSQSAAGHYHHYEIIKVYVYNARVLYFTEYGKEGNDGCLLSERSKPTKRIIDTNESFSPFSFFPDFPSSALRAHVGENVLE